MAQLDFQASEEGSSTPSTGAAVPKTGRWSYGPGRGEKRESQAMKCPYCEHEITEFASEYSYAQAEIIVVVMCPHCRKILGIVNHDCED